MFFPFFAPLVAQVTAPPEIRQNATASATSAFTAGLKAYQSGTLAGFLQAQKDWENALVLWQTLKNSPQEAVTRNFLCLLYDRLGDYPQSLSCYQALLTLSQSLDDRQTEASTLTAIARLQSRLGQYQDALGTLDKSQSIWQETKLKSGEVAVINEIALIYFNLGDWEQSSRYYKKALNLAEGLGNQAMIAGLYENLAQVSLESEDLAQALRLSQQALSQWDQLLAQWGKNAAPEIPRGKATSLNNLAFIYVKQGKRELARRTYGQALSLWQSLGDRRGEASTLNNLGYVYFLGGNLDQAQSHYQQALALRQSMGDRPKQAISRYSLAVLEGRRGNLRQAQQEIEQALAIVEDLRGNINSQELKTSFLASKQDYYQFYIDILMQLHRQFPQQGWDAKALAVSERSKARSLLDVLAQSPGQISTGISAELLSQKSALQQQLGRLEEQRLQLFGSNTFDTKKLAAIETEIASLLQTYRQLLDKISRVSPRYAQLTQAQTLTLTQIQGLLDAETVLLEYALGPDRSYLWVVTSNSLQSYQLPKAQTINEAVKGFRESFLVPTQRIRRALATEQGASLRNLVIPPAIALKKRVAIIGDGALQYLPFSALIEKTEANTAPRYLVDGHELISLPSASVLAQLRRDLGAPRSGSLRDRPLAPRSLAVFADPVFSVNDERLKGVAPLRVKPLSPELARSARESGVLFDRLPFTRSEAEQILALVSGKNNLPELGFEANRERLLNQQLSQYRYLHFATHGLLNSKNPQLSGLVLSLLDQKGRSVNGFLRLYDIFNLNLPAELVVLSACETGLGQEVKGEGLISLTRGFIYAGAARVVVSLWSVDDRATSLLMVKFYEGILQKNLSPAQALQEAQQALKQDPNFASPYFWAGFTLQGEWRSPQSVVPSKF